MKNFMGLIVGSFTIEVLIFSIAFGTLFPVLAALKFAIYVLGGLW